MPSITLLRISTLIFVACLLGSGCSSKPTIPTGWSKAEVESNIKEGGKFREVHLTEAGGGGGFERNGSATQTRATRNYEGSGTGENGHTYKIKATYTYSENDGKGSHDLHWDADDSEGDQKSGTYTGSVA
jgi:hypothetical protein